MNIKATSQKSIPPSATDEPKAVLPGIMVYNRFTVHGKSTLQYLRELGLPDYTDLEGTGYADISEITRSIISPEEMEHARKVEKRFKEFTEAYEMVCGLQKNPRKALLRKKGASPIPLTESELREAFAWQKNIPTAKSMAKEQRKTFFNTECLPVMAMIFNRAKSHLDGVIKMRVADELARHQEQVDRFFKDDKNFRFQASGELRGLIKRYIYLADFQFTEYLSSSGGLAAQLKGILNIN